MAAMMAPSAPFNLTGIGGQFDFDEPFLDGYQILPRRSVDIEVILSVEELLAEYGVEVFPNPVSDVLNIHSNLDVLNVEIYDISGAKLLESSDRQISISHLLSGNYFLKFQIESQLVGVPFIKQ